MSRFESFEVSQNQQILFQNGTVAKRIVSKCPEGYTDSNQFQNVPVSKQQVLKCLGVTLRIYTDLEQF